MTPQLRLTFVAGATSLLSTLALAPLFASGAWFPRTAFVVLLTVAACAVARHLGASRPLVPLAGAGALTFGTMVAFASDKAWLGILPTAHTVERLAGLAVEGHRHINEYAAPITPTTGVVMLTAAGVGLVALAVDTLAVTFRQVALAGVPLIALYAVPASVTAEGIGWVAFAVGAGAYLTLLLTDARDRVGRWGRMLDQNGLRPGTQVQTAPLSAAGRRVGVAAVSLAVLLPLVPGLDRGFLTGSGGFGPGRGSGTVAVVNPILDLRDNLNRRSANVPVLRYTTNDPNPSYVRLAALDEFSGDKWEPGTFQVPRSQRVDEGMPNPVGLTAAVPRTTVRTEMTVIGDFDSRWLPLPSVAQRVGGLDGRWLYDLGTWNVFSSTRLTGQDYTVESMRVQPTAEQLRAAVPAGRQYGPLSEAPDELPASLERVADSITASSRTNYDRAVAIQTWLRDTDRFEYDEQAPGGNGISAIEEFLRVKRGFCVHFASAMALMARTQGIPSRVAVGFLPGRASGVNEREVRLHDAHAWPELYFEGVGWVPFEPTPGRRTGAPPAYTQTGNGAEPTPEESASAAPEPTASATAAVGGRREAERNQGESGDAEQSVPLLARVPWRGLGVGAAAIAVLLVPALVRRSTRRFRWRRAADPAAQVLAGWAEVRDTALDLGYVVTESETPRQFASRLTDDAQLAGEPAAGLARLARSTERVRYSARPGELADSRTDADHVCRALLAGVGRGMRWRALLAPRSVLALAHAAGEFVADGLDWVDDRARAARAALLRRPALRSRD